MVGADVPERVVALILLEASVDTVASGIAAERGGADRIELCDNLADAGTTPSHGTLVAALAALTIPVFPIIRSRGGAFVYDADDVAIMTADIRHARSLGVHGLVVGALTAEGDVDERSVGIWRDAAGDLPITFHRAFDVCRDQSTAIETLIRLGVTRVLSSGRRATALQGREQLAAAVRQAAGRLVIMAGGGVDESNVRELVEHTGVGEVHVRGTVPHQEPMVFQPHPVPFRKNWPEDESIRMVTDTGRIGAVRAAVRGEG
jgi:copper homeostasis protein